MSAEGVVENVGAVAGPNMVNQRFAGGLCPAIDGHHIPASRSGIAQGYSIPASLTVSDRQKINFKPSHTPRLSVDRVEDLYLVYRAESETLYATGAIANGWGGLPTEARDEDAGVRKPGRQ